MQNIRTCPRTHTLIIMRSLYTQTRPNLHVTYTNLHTAIHVNTHTPTLTHKRITYTYLYVRTRVGSLPCVYVSCNLAAVALLLAPPLPACFL